MNDKNNDQLPEGDDKNRSGGPKLPFDDNKKGIFILAGVVILLMFAFSMFNNFGGQKRITYNEFFTYLESGSIREVEIVDDTIIRGMLADVGDKQVAFVTRIPYLDMGLVEKLLDSNVKISGKTNANTFGMIILQILPWILMLIFFFWMFRSMNGGGRAFNFGKSKAKRYDHDQNKITFQDVAGQEEAKYELTEVVDFLKNPKKFSDIGARIPRGVLLVGGPGTGKTLMARAVAGEADVAFFHMSGSDFVEMFVGVGASRVRDLFEQGKRNAPCILFIDEIDAVGRTRGAGYGGGHDEREQTLNQLLVEMDGFGTQSGVIIMAATNRPDVLDPALLRPGRFDRQVVVDLPDVKERQAILGIHCKKVKLAKEVDLNVIARATPGSSGADLANIVNEAALYAARASRETVNMADFEEARDKILMGVARKSKVMSDKERQMTAYHEAGHALLHYHLENADPVHKVTIIPRGRALGVTFSLPEKDIYCRGRNWLLDEIKILYGGFAAEDLVYSETTTGTQNDLKRATEIAHRMVCEWGMSEKLGPMSFGGDEPIFIGKEIARHKDYSESTANMIDDEIKAMLDRCMKEAISILKKNFDQLELLAKTLVERETLDDAQIRELLGFDPKKPVDDDSQVGLEKNGQ